MDGEDELRQEVAAENVRPQQMMRGEGRLRLLDELDERLARGIRSKSPREHRDDNEEPERARRDDP